MYTLNSVQINFKAKFHECVQQKEFGYIILFDFFSFNPRNLEKIYFKTHDQIIKKRALHESNLCFN